MLNRFRAESIFQPIQILPGGEKTAESIVEGNNRSAVGVYDSRRMGGIELTTTGLAKYVCGQGKNESINKRGRPARYKE